jgi:hypothetical protein
MEQLFGELKKYRWSLGTLQVWAECDFRCAYCDADLLSSYDLYALGQTDHLLPRGAYPQLCESPSNHVLSCWTCNRLKRHWDPNTRVGDMIFTQGVALTSEQRRTLIDRAATYVKSLRTHRSAELSATVAAVAEFRRRGKGAHVVEG